MLSYAKFAISPSGLIEMPPIVLPDVPSSPCQTAASVSKPRKRW